MNFGEAVDIVVGITKRPDKVVEARLAVNRAIENYNKDANWAADLVELTVNIDSSLYAQSFVISSNLANFRKIKYIRPTEWTRYLTFQDPSKIFETDNFGRDCQKVNVWYRAGDRIILGLGSLAASLEIGYYRRWDYLTANSATHWMLTDCPSMITDKAIGDIFETIGADTEALRYRGYAQRSFTSAENDLADGVNRWQT